MVGFIGGLVLFVCVVVAWLRGHAVGRWMMFAALTAAGCFVVAASPRFAGAELIGYAVAAGLAWVVAALPLLVAGVGQFVPVRADGSPNVALEFVRPHVATDPLKDH